MVSQLKWTHWLKWILSVGLTIGLLFYFKNEFRNVNLNSIWLKITSLTLLVAIVGSLLNWFIEAIKWHILINKLQKNTVFTSFKAVLSGTAVSNIFPFKLGEYLGKLYYVKPEFKEQSLVFSLVCSLTQLIVNLSLTLILGFRKIAFLKIGNSLTEKAIYFGIVLVIIWLLLKWKSAYLKKILLEFKVAFTSISKKELLKLFLLSLLRLMVFYGTYTFILFQITQIGFFEIVEGIGAIYFLQSFAPGMVVTDSAIRLALPLFIFNWYVVKEDLIAAAMLNYFASMVLPTFLGLGFILHSLRLKK